MQLLAHLAAASEHISQLPITCLCDPATFGKTNLTHLPSKRNLTWKGKQCTVSGDKAGRHPPSSNPGSSNLVPPLRHCLTVLHSPP